MIVILGNTGFVGRHLSDILKENNLPFVGASRKSGLDLRDPDSCFKFFSKKKIRIIINCAVNIGGLNYASKQAGNIIADNSRMVVSMYEAVAKTCPEALVINPVANCVYPANADIYSEERLWDGSLHASVASFGETRRLLLAVGESFATQHYIKSIYLVTPNMYGPYESTDPNKAHALNALVSKFVKARHENTDVEIWGTGKAIREWLYATDFARIVFEIIKKPSKFNILGPMNIAQKHGLSVKELAQIIKNNFPDFKGRIIWNRNMQDGTPKKIMNDIKFREIFPNFLFTSLEEGIKKTIKYYESMYPYGEKT